MRSRFFTMTVVEIDGRPHLLAKLEAMAAVNMSSAYFAAAAVDCGLTRG